MNHLETYEFDRQGYLVIRDMLTPEDVRALAQEVDILEERAILRIGTPPLKKSLWGPVYHYDEETGCHMNGAKAKGQTILVEDFFNASPEFDRLVDHPATMALIHGLVQGLVRINNSEIRIRYPGNTTGTHQGGPISPKYRYGFNAGGIDCMMVRMIYFLHDVSAEEGAFCVVPGTHKSNLPSPYACGPAEEPGMIPLEVKAGDAILFTEHLRHGGFTNRSPRTRKTLHVGYGPHWMMSQNISTMDEPQHLTAPTLARYTQSRRALFVHGQGKPPQ
jgi:hypothetical protein